MRNSAPQMPFDAVQVRNGAPQLRFGAVELLHPIITSYLMSYVLDILHYVPVLVFMTILLCITKGGD